MIYYFIGMWINFVISVIVIVFVIGILNSMLRVREVIIVKVCE